MALLAWLLIALGLCAPLLTGYVTAANPGETGYVSGTGYLVSIAAIAWLLVQRRSKAQEERARLYMIASAIVVAANLWSSFKVVQVAQIDKEVAAARPRANAIMQAAAAETALLHSRQISSTEVSPGWQVYEATPAIDLADDTVPLRERFVEITKRAKSRELDLVRELIEETEASGINTALSTVTLNNAAGRADSLARAERYRTFMQSFPQRIDALTKQIEADTRLLKLPRINEQQMMDGTGRRARENAAPLRQFVDQELQAIESVQAVIRFVEAHAETARIENGLLVFADADVQADFEALAARIELAED